jgi:hypothetical protein
MTTSRHGPDIRPVSREDKVEEWFGALQASLRHRDGGMLTDGEATGWADRYWLHLAGLRMPVKDIMHMHGKSAVEWVLATDEELALAVGMPHTEEAP